MNIIKARERLEAMSTITVDNIYDVIMLAYDDKELAKTMENKMLMAQMKNKALPQR